MGARFWTVASLLLLGQARGDVPVSNQRGFQIPLDIEPAVRQQLKEIRLFVSRDQGKSWDQRESAKPEQNGFVFHANEDGLYWFRVAAVDLQGRQEPEDLLKSPPESIQKMLIDTIRPLVRVNAYRQGDEVSVSWEIAEANPDLNSLKMEYHTLDNPAQWATVPLNPNLKGDTRFRPPSAAALEVRIELKDRAGNRGVGNVEVSGSTAVAAASPPSTSIPAADKKPNLVAPPPAGPSGIAPPPEVRTTPPSPANVAPPPRMINPPPAEPLPGGPPPIANPYYTTPAHDNTRLVASSETIAGVPGSGPRKKLPDIQFINAPEVTFEYELTKIGPSGIGSIEFYWTKNDGQTWERYAVDDTVKPNMPSGRYQRTAELNQGDGVYGFTMIVKNRVGRGRPEPRPGDVPEIRIGLDTTPPSAKLFAGPDPQRPGHLLLQWAANDPNLTPTPITLEWCERPNGNWHPIAANQANTGRYAWKVPEGIPYQVFLRLRVRDAAGNEGVAVTNEAQIVDLSEPEGHLLNVTVPRRP
jgi:hypothetical protein